MRFKILEEIDFESIHSFRLENFKIITDPYVVIGTTMLQLCEDVFKSAIHFLLITFCFDLKTAKLSNSVKGWFIWGMYQVTKIKATMIVVTKNILIIK